MSRVLVIGDLHLPVAHPGYLPFCQDLYEKWNCNKVVFIGDIVDWHAISFWTHDPNCPGSKDEYDLSLKKVKEWYEAFPDAKICIGNHDERPERLAKTVQIPECLLKSYDDVWKTKRWEWAYDYIIDDVYYFHGTSRGAFSPQHPAWNAMGKMLMPVVMGHFHARAGVVWKANPLKRIFGVDTGCGIDIKAFQFVYGKSSQDRPILSAAAIIDGIPYHEIMPIGENEKYNKKKFKRSKK